MSGTVLPIKHATHALLPLELAYDAKQEIDYNDLFSILNRTQHSQAYTITCSKNIKCTRTTNDVSYIQMCHALFSNDRIREKIH